MLNRAVSVLFRYGSQADFLARLLRGIFRQKTRRTGGPNAARAVRSALEQVRPQTTVNMDDRLDEHLTRLRRIKNVVRLKSVTTPALLDLERCDTRTGKLGYQLEAVLQPGDIGVGLKHAEGLIREVDDLGKLTLGGLRNPIAISHWF